MILRYGYKRGLMPAHQIDVIFPTDQQRNDIEVLTLTHQRQLMTYVKEHFTFPNLEQKRKCIDTMGKMLK